MCACVCMSMCTCIYVLASYIVHVATILIESMSSCGCGFKLLWYDDDNIWGVVSGCYGVPEEEVAEDTKSNLSSFTTTPWFCDPCKAGLNPASCVRSVFYTNCLCLSLSLPLFLSLSLSLPPSFSPSLPFPLSLSFLLPLPNAKA